MFWAPPGSGQLLRRTLVHVPTVDVCIYERGSVGRVKKDEFAFRQSIFGYPFWVRVLHFVLKKRGSGVLARPSFFLFPFLRFPGRLDPRSAAACAVETQFSVFGVALGWVSFLHPFWQYVGDIWAPFHAFDLFVCCDAFGSERVHGRGCGGTPVVP